jgi:S-adenosylmethionine:tRNA ribosyltransferase-isomerase
MHISEFDYDLPQELIAQEPLPERDASRMLVLDRRNKNWRDSTFREFPNFVEPNDVVAINNTRVIPARLKGRRHTSGGHVEVFLVRELEPNLWSVLVRPSARLHAGMTVVFGDGHLKAVFEDEPGSDLRKVHFEFEGSLDDVLAKVGSTPLPPYIKRPAGVSLTDEARYQTVYSKHRGAIAAPTAGLHFTPKTLSTLKERNQLVEITLHVGYGTFEPVRVGDVNQHEVSSEIFEILPEAANRINEARRRGGRIIAIGTTTTRALETSTNNDNEVVPAASEARLTIKPGYKFRLIDILLTNFHLPRSSLLILVSAFAGQDLILKAYNHAVRERYRFYSYGDCMLIL